MSIMQPMELVSPNCDVVYEGGKNVGSVECDVHGKRQCLPIET